jgi:hypothetical protein
VTKVDADKQRASQLPHNAVGAERLDRAVPSPLNTNQAHSAVLSPVCGAWALTPKTARSDRLKPYYDDKIADGTSLDKEPSFLWTR